jgi:hypothetical protein
MHSKRPAARIRPHAHAIPLAIAVTFLLAAPALADVTIQEKTVSTGLGGFGNGTTTTTRVIAADKGREDEQFTYTGRMKTFAGKPRSSSTITRLDKELIWDLDHNKKQYGEMTFAEMREAMARGAAEAKAEMAKSGDAHAQQDVKFEYKVDVQRTGKKDKVNGFDAEQWIITLTASPKDKQTGESAGAFKMKLDGWYSTQVPGQAEVAAYYRRWAEKMGIDPQVRTMASSLMAAHGDAVKEIAAKMKDLKGVAVRSTMTMDMGLGLTPEQQAELDKARKDEAKSRAENTKKQDARDDLDAKKDAASSLSHGNVSGALGGFLSRKLNKAAEKKVEASVTPKEGSSGGPAFSVTTDMLSVTTGSAAGSFDVPAGYKKVERKDRQ